MWPLAADSSASRRVLVPPSGSVRRRATRGSRHAAPPGQRPAARRQPAAAGGESPPRSTSQVVSGGDSTRACRDKCSSIRWRSIHRRRRVFARSPPRSQHSPETRHNRRNRAGTPLRPIIVRAACAGHLRRVGEHLPRSAGCAPRRARSRCSTRRCGDHASACDRVSADQAGLGHAVGAAVAVRAERLLGDDVDDPAPAARRHRRPERLAEQERRGQVGGQRDVPVVLGELGPSAGAGSPRRR